MSYTATETVTAPPQQPDISYHPDPVKWHERTTRRLRADPSLLSAKLPPGLPEQAEGPMVWSGEDWESEDQWVYRLNDSELKEIEDAVAHFKGLNLEMGFIAPETFPLPTLSATLRTLAEQLHTGRGFFVIRTIPVDSYSKADLTILYAGVSSHVASLRGTQDSKGTVIGHIKDLTITHAHERSLGIGSTTYTADKQVYHSDVGDLISLFAIQIAAEGGTSRITSCGKIYNTIASTRPDLIKVLAEPWPIDRFGDNPPYVTRPLLHWDDGHIIIQYSRRHFTGFNEQKRSPNIPPITEAQAEALDALHHTAEKHNLGLNFQKGDIQYINSMGLLHGRDGFRDSAEKTRHLIRLWLRNDELAWHTPEPLDPIWKRLYSVPPEKQRFPIEPEIRRKEGGKTQ